MFPNGSQICALDILGPTADHGLPRRGDRYDHVDPRSEGNESVAAHNPTHWPGQIKHHQIGAGLVFLTPGLRTKRVDIDGQHGVFMFAKQKFDQVCQIHSYTKVEHPQGLATVSLPARQQYRDRFVFYQ